MKARVVIVGSYVQDLAFYVREFPRPGECVLAELRPGAGGKGFNQAVAATRAGAPPSSWAPSAMTRPDPTPGNSPGKRGCGRTLW